MTKAEACIWKYVLKARMMKGYQFRRQRPVLDYIADFMCKELNLIIEIDGITHSYEGVYIKDQRRTQELGSEGFTVLRYGDEEVLQNIEHVRESIADWIEKNAQVPPPSPRQRGTN
ncbi:endonuclease domain-containing protein [Reichenbachiella agarivorans]|uniref:Endonuclease domain-containing protein n=1 Tax=Reichenbachiella agarivorans TaxID=2979464 RepID=A0ABY6CQS9_9BACT|nr:endonuclease domain-containing protein [Reichenbachiella agarivorans]UXP32870.1 endonuclease domain-containing protein [Reichenbachiella agarivorans]